MLRHHCQGFRPCHHMSLANMAGESHCHRWMMFPPKKTKPWNNFHSDKISTQKNSKKSEKNRNTVLSCFLVFSFGIFMFFGCSLDLLFSVFFELYSLLFFDLFFSFFGTLFFWWWLFMLLPFFWLCCCFSFGGNFVFSMLFVVFLWDSSFLIGLLFGCGLEIEYNLWGTTGF